jgi:predicted transcriptional regulator
MTAKAGPVAPEPIARTTIELPKSLLARVKAYAALRHTSVKRVVQEALETHVKASEEQEGPAWRRGFGAFAHQKEETARIQAIIDEEFSRIDPEDWK